MWLSFDFSIKNHTVNTSWLEITKVLLLMKLCCIRGWHLCAKSPYWSHFDGKVQSYHHHFLIYIREVILIKIKIVYLVADLHLRHILLKDTQDREESWILVRLTSMLHNVNNEGLTQFWLSFTKHNNVRVLTSPCVY